MTRIAWCDLFADVLTGGELTRARVEAIRARQERDQHRRAHAVIALDLQALHARSKAARPAGEDHTA